MHLYPSVLFGIVQRFRGCFTAPGYGRFVEVLTGWILVPGVHTITRVVRVARQLGSRVHHSSVYRFLSQGRWSSDSVSRVLLGLLRPWLGETVVAIVDDTLCAKSGRQLFGVGIHHDVTRSVYSRQGRRIDVFAHGHNWVVLAVHVPSPWDPQRGWAVPVQSRLYRPPGRCPAADYRKRSELALEMIHLLNTWLGRPLYVTGDATYCCKTVLRGLPQGVRFVGPAPLDAALYSTLERPSLRGRPRRKGYRIASPRVRLAKRGGFEAHAVDLYGRSVQVQLASLACIWYPSAGVDPLRVVITRDRKNPRDGRAYVCTDPDLSPEAILGIYALRWRLEVSFRDLKQELGFEDPRNGWWRRPRGQRDDPCLPPHRPAAHRGRKAVERTAPLAGLAYAVVVCWYLAHGTPQLDVIRARAHAPWYRHKREISFQDMLRACRRAIGAQHFQRMRLPSRLRKIAHTLLEIGQMAA